MGRFGGGPMRRQRK